MVLIKMHEFVKALITSMNKVNSHKFQDTALERFFFNRLLPEATTIQTPEQQINYGYNDD